MKIFREVVIGKFALRFLPSDNGWMCGISNEMMDALEEQAYEFEFLPVDPTIEMKKEKENDNRN